MAYFITLTRWNFPAYEWKAENCKFKRT